MEKTIYVVTCGQVESGKANPGLTMAAMSIAGTIAAKMPEIKIQQVIIGTGFRHSQVAVIMDLNPDAYSVVCGSESFLDPDAGIAFLTDGAEISGKKFLVPDGRSFLNSLEEGTLLVTDQTFLKNLGFKEAKEGQLVQINNDVDDRFPFLDFTKFEVLFDPNPRLQTAETLND